MQLVRTLLKKEESYAVHALLDIAEHPGTSASDIAKRLQMPYAFMTKVLRKLVERNYIQSQTGRSGGVHLLVDLNDVSVLNVMEAISGPVLLDTCQTQKRCATQKRKGYCKLNTAWVAATLEINSVLENMRLGDFYDPPETT